LLTFMQRKADETIHKRQPRRATRPTPQVTIEAIMWCVRERGPPALSEPANIARLRECDSAALEQINVRLTKGKAG
jgi:hypothetical protein